MFQLSTSAAAKWHAVHLVTMKPPSVFATCGSAWLMLWQSEQGCASTAPVPPLCAVSSPPAMLLWHASLSQTPAALPAPL